MMQFMRFRSPNSSSSSKDNELKHSSPSPSTPNAPPPSSLSSSSSSMATGRPIRLVYSDSKGKFQMDPEAVAALQLVKGPIGVVSVCGRARQGKSYILNKLLGGSSGFQVASTHKPCTKGLWMWSAPLRRKSIDGTEYNLVLLDSEGIDAYDQTGTYSTQIFSLALLLSSMFIYNQMGGIDEAALDRLSLVTEMTRHIRVKAERSSDSELGEYSPIFVWLLRDFYLDLVEDGRRITPRDYLELALRPMVGEGRDVGPRNEIRRSIRALFPERECFTLVRPLTDEAALQKLDQIPLQDLRPEFKAGLGALIRFVQERTKPKQVGATVMTGPIFVGLTQSFLDALNNGAVPTIASAWQSVEEMECRKAYELAAEVYMSSFDRSKPPDAVLLGEAHEDAVRKSMAAFNANVVGAGEARQRYNNMLTSFLRKAFEDYKRTAFMEAELKCSNALQSMERDLRAICNTPNVKLDQVLKVLHDLCSEYESSSYGPGKWQKLSSFLQQSLEGPVFDLVRKKLDQLTSEKSEVMLKLRVSEDKLELLRKQLEANEKHRADLLKRYEEAISDKRKTTEEYSGRVFDLQSKYSSLEGRYSNLSKTLEAEKQESSEWKRKYENTVSKKAAEEERINAERTALQSRTSTAEARLAAALEQSQAAQEEAAEWRRKFDNAVKEAKLALEKAAAVQERFNKQIQLKEESLKAEFSASLIRKDEEIKDKIKRLEKAEHQIISLISQLKASEAKIRDHDLESTTLKDEIKELQEKLDSAKSAAQSYEREAKIMEQQKNHIEQRYLSEFKRLEEVEDRCRAAEKEAKRAVELADKARSDAVVAQREKNDMQRLAMERMAQIERGERQIEGLERQKVELAEEVERLRASEMDAVSKVALLEARVDEREKEIEELMKSTNEQRTSTVKVLESLLATERAARAEANTRAEALSLQLESTQGKLDSVHQELTSVRLNETALDSKLKTASHAKRIRVQDYAGTESVHDMDMDVDGERTRKKRSKSMTSPVPLHLHTEDGGSVFKPGDEGGEASEEPQESEDYNKFTVLKLKQELTKHGFGAQLLQLRNPNKKDILALYEKHVLEK